MKRIFFLYLGAISSLFSDEVELDNIQVKGEIEKPIEKKFLKSSGNTIGDLLKEETFVDSASFGPAVGRPVVKGLDGYRVAITNGSMGINDLSAMSHDHSVAMMTKSVQKVELIKGSSSLLYGGNSGGVVKTLGEEHNPDYREELSGEVEGLFGTGGAGNLFGGKIYYGESDFLVYGSYYNHSADDYSDGSGNTIKGSDTSAQQAHFVGGYLINSNNLIKIYYDQLYKDYGIPNSTKEYTSIDMEQDRFGLVLHSTDIFGLKSLQTEIESSDYIHTEFEGNSADGLFGQKQFGINSRGVYEAENHSLKFNVQYRNSEYQVCHEHGKCTDFYGEPRTTIVDGISLKQNMDRFGIPYSHGHPMPNIDENTLSVALFYQTLLNNTFIFDSSFRVEHRDLSVDESNIQEEWLATENGHYDDVTDIAKSGSIGGILFLEPFEVETTLSYIERMPSANELYWNGFHHATDSYIFGDIDLKNEKSVNFDLSGRWRTEEFLTQIDSFYYNFSNYIFQDPKGGLRDPFHKSEVWETKGLKAKLFGVSFKESYETTLWDIDQKHSLSLQAIRGVFSDDSSIPRISPHRISFESELNYNSLQTIFQLKYFDKSRFTASNESSTPPYYQMNLSLNYLYKITNRESLNIYFKGYNLTNQQGYNHISFLKDTAPVAGVQLSLGAKYSF